MWDIVRRLLWFAIVASAFAYVLFLIIGSVVSAQAARVYDPVIVRDELSPGAHHLSGMIMVGTRCDELSVHTEQLSATDYSLDFTTWREPSVDCGNEEIPRAFREVLFAPAAGVQFTATLDGQAFPLVVIPVIQGKNVP